MILLITGASDASASWTARAEGLRGALEAIQRRIAHQRLIQGLAALPVNLSIDVELTDSRTVLYVFDDTLAGIADLDPPRHAGPDRPNLHWDGRTWTSD